MRCSFSFLLWRFRVGISNPRRKRRERVQTFSFHELGVSEPVIEALAANGIAEPFRIQSLVIPDALSGIDVLAKSPTGSGKTLAFAIPIVERAATDGTQPSALVLVPTRELALQVADELEQARPGQGPAHRRRLRRLAGAQAGERREGRARARRDAGPAAGSDGPAPGRRRRRHHARARRGRPHARHGLPAAGREDHAAAAAQAPDDALLGHARRRGGRAGPRVHAQPARTSRPSGPCRSAATPSSTTPSCP